MTSGRNGNKLDIHMQKVPKFKCAACALDTYKCTYACISDVGTVQGAGVCPPLTKVGSIVWFPPPYTHTYFLSRVLLSSCVELSCAPAFYYFNITVYYIGLETGRW